MLQYGETALHKAAEGGYVEVVEMLVKYGAIVEIRDMVYFIIQNLIEDYLMIRLKQIL